MMNASLKTLNRLSGNGAGTDSPTSIDFRPK